jgi:uncharacterized protein
MWVRHAPFIIAIACSAIALAYSHRASGAGLERSVQAPGPLGPLRGTLLEAQGVHAPVALLLPGSGPTDRDGNGPSGLKSATYRLLAEALAGRGISVARVDKRGMFTSANAVADANDVTLQDYASDAHAWVGALRGATGARCAWVIGHSEGGLVALLAGDRDPGICGAILVATPGRPLAQILREQLRSNPANTPLLGAASRIIDSLETGRHVSAADIPSALLPQFDPRVQDFLIHTMAIDPAREIARYGKPVLVVQGDRDLQVGVEDAILLTRAAPAAELALVTEANHVLKRVPDSGRAANLATYADPSLPVADGVVDAIATFIFKHTGP